MVKKMGVQKRIYLKLNNKKLYPKIKAYSFYRKDIWGILKYRRRFKYKRALIAFFRGKRTFYKRILHLVYKGIKFYIRKKSLRANIFFAKRRLKLFYGSLRDSQFGKLKLLFSRTRGVQINHSFGTLERRLDVILVRALYFRTVVNARIFIKNRNIYINELIKKNIYDLVKVGDLVSINIKPNSFFFLPYSKIGSLDTKVIQLKFINRFFYELFPYNRNLLYRMRSRGFKYFWKDFNITKFNFFNFLIFFTKFFKFLRIFFYIIRRRLRKRIRIKRDIFYLINTIFESYRRVVMLLGFVEYVCKYPIGFFNVRNRWIKVMRLMKSKFMKKKPRFLNRFFRRIPLSKSFRKVRFWRLSKKALLKMFFQFRFRPIQPIWAGYPPYMEISYKSHQIVVVQKPLIEMVKYPFTMKSKLFFEYFKQKAFI